MADERSDGSGMGLPTFSSVLGWGSALGGEVARLPTTVARARKVVAVLPDHLEELVEALDRFTKLLDQSLGEVRDEVSGVSGRLETLQASIDGLAGELGSTKVGLDTALPVLSEVVVRLDERVERMDDLLAQVSGSVVGTINAVPGLRRVTRRTKPTEPS